MSETPRGIAMRDAIAAVFAEHAEHPSDRGLITKFVVIAEVIGDDGEPYLKRVNDDGPMWRTVGMLTAISDDLRDALRNSGDSSDDDESTAAQS